jgi:hypothetical protein
MMEYWKNEQKKESRIQKAGDRRTTPGMIQYWKADKTKNTEDGIKSNRR